LAEKEDSVEEHEYFVSFSEAASSVVLLARQFEVQSKRQQVC